VDGVEVVPDDRTVLAGVVWLFGCATLDIWVVADPGWVVDGVARAGFGL
jgi:hypothetical protein